MLILDTPLHLGTQTYTRLVGGIKGEWDLRTRRIEVTISPARERAGQLVIATREHAGESLRLLAPPVVATLTLQDAIPADPALAPIFQKLHELVEAIEALMVTNGSLAGQVYLAGEEDVSLNATFTSSATPGIIEDKIKS